jgi:hypothetical protein
MKAVRLFLSCALVLTLASCASLKAPPSAYMPPKIDCAALDVPRLPSPIEPGLDEKAVVLWQLYAWGWQAYVEDVLTQRVETAQCLQTLREQRVIR